MAINKNHEFDDLEGIKCAIVEKNISEARSNFLKKILEHNQFTVVVIPTPPPKTASVQTELPELTEATFTVGVTDVTFNPINAIFGRTLKTTTGQVVTLAFWHQKETSSHDEIPYFE